MQLIISPSNSHRFIPVVFPVALDLTHHYAGLKPEPRDDDVLEISDESDDEDIRRIKVRTVAYQIG